MHAPPFSALAAVYDTLMDDVEYDAWADFILTYARDGGLNPVRALDVACGTGGLALELRRAGLEVEGLDASAEMLAVARRKLPEMRFHPGDLRGYGPGPGHYDLITCVFDSLNNLTDPGDLGLALNEMAAHLNPGGLAAFDLNTRLGVRELWEGNAVEGLAPMEDGREVHYHWSHHHDPGSELGTVQAFCRVLDGEGEGQEFVEVHQERGYDPADLEPLLRSAGFGRWEIVEYPDYGEVNEQTPRIWVLAWK